MHLIVNFFRYQNLRKAVSTVKKLVYVLNIFTLNRDFVEYILKILFALIKRELLLVYNLARDGRKEGKKIVDSPFCDYFSINYTGSKCTNSLLMSYYKFIWESYCRITSNIPITQTVCIKDGEGIR